MDFQWASVDWYTWVVLPALIFCARVTDVSMDTMRVIFVSRGVRLLAAGLGFFEILIWLLAISATMQNMTNPLCYVAYAGGFATGNYVGVSIEAWLSIGRVIVRVITQKDATELLAALCEGQWGVTAMDAQGANGPVKIILTVIDRKDIAAVLGMVRQFNPKAFYTIEDVRSVHEGVHPPAAAGRSSRWSRFLYRSAER